MEEKPQIQSAYAGAVVETIGEQPFFSTLLDAVGDGILAVDAGGEVVFANPAMERILGYDPDALIDAPFADLISEHHRGHYTAAFRSYLGSHCDEFDWSGVQMPLRHADGHDVPSEISFRKAEVGDKEVYTGIIHDLSKRDEAENLHEETDEQLVSLVQEVKDYAMFTLDQEGFIRNWNPGARNIKGYDEEEIIGRHFSTFYTEADTEAGVPERNLDEAVENGRCEDRGWRVRKDGSHFWAKVLITPLWYDDGTLRGFAKVTQDITEQREQEQKLRQERELLDGILNTVPVAISVSSPEGETLRANDRAAELLGLSKEELLNGPENPDEWLVYDGDGNELPDETQPAARVIASGEPVYNEELVIQRPDGTRTWFSVSAAPMFDEDGEIERLVSAAEDITELKRLQRELERERDSLQAELDEVFGRITEAVFALDEEWRIEYMNENMLTLVGDPMEELMGGVLWEVLPGISGTKLEEEYRRAMECQEAKTFEYAWEDTWFEVHAYPSETGLSVYFRDITERKRRKQELERTVHKLEASNEKLERFAYVTSHDLQEPLRMVSSYLQLLESRYADDLDEDAEEFIDFAVNGADRMRNMIDGLLEYSRVSRGDRESNPVDCDVVLEKALDNVQVEIEATDAEIDAEPLPTVQGDEEHLVQLFQNLLSNAIKYHGDGSPHVRVRAERDDDEWVLSVSDDGIGIDEHQTDRIFEIFNRLHTEEEYEGTGIGLAICREIVENHGGEIRVDSVPGEGSTFSFTLPA